MSRLQQLFARKPKNILNVYFTAGYPALHDTGKVIRALDDAGVDLIEVGMPYSDPLADGPTIQESGQQAIQNGMTLPLLFEQIAEARQYTDIPLVLMGYFNPIYHYGVEKFSQDAVAAGVDGLIIVDLPPEEDAELRLPAAHAGLRMIRLATPTTDEKRLPQIIDHASGFIYYVAVAGITGTKSSVASDVSHAVARIKAETDVPVAVGFGIKTPEQAAEIAKTSDAVVVGSAIVRIVADNLDQNGRATPGIPSKIEDFVGTLATAVRKARTASTTTAG